ncbi:hypothetical protein JCM16303_007110, partial [Sporobolomyces ruberrimus]
DLLPHLRPSYLLSSVDTLLHYLTHPSPFRRRFSLALVFLSFPTFLYFLSHSTTSAPLPAGQQLQSTTFESPSWPLPVEVPNSQELVSFIDSYESSYSFSQSSHLVPITVVIINPNYKDDSREDPKEMERKTKRLIELQLRWVKRFPFFREIIVWNDNQRYNLKRDDFNFSSSSSVPVPVNLRIYNSPTPLSSLSPHYACSLSTASSQHCYFPSTTSTLKGELNMFLDSSYLHYIESCAGNTAVVEGKEGKGKQVGRGMGGRIFALVQGEKEGEEMLRKKVSNPSINLHTGLVRFSSPPSNSYASTPSLFFPKHLSEQFLRQVTYTSTMRLPGSLRIEPRELEQRADTFFSIWTNEVPEIWVVPKTNNTIRDEGQGEMKEIEREGGRDDSAELDEVEDQTILKALRILTIALTSSPSSSDSAHSHPTSPFLSSKPYESSPPPPPPPPSHAKAPCANDQCIFLTSLGSTSSSNGGDLVEMDRLFNEKFYDPTSSSSDVGGSRSSKGGSWWVVKDEPSRQFKKNKKADHESEPRISKGFNPFLLDSFKNSYELLWDTLGPSPRIPSIAYYAVDSEISSTCFESNREISKEDYIGLEFIGPPLDFTPSSDNEDREGGLPNFLVNSRLGLKGGRVVRKVELVSRNEAFGKSLREGKGGSEREKGARVVSWERVDEVIEEGGQGWVVFTERRFGIGGWEPRQLVDDTSTTSPILFPPPSSSSSSSNSKVPHGTKLFKTTFELVPIETRTTFSDPSRGTFELMEEGEIEISKIKLVRIGAAKVVGKQSKEEEVGDRLELCGWILDGVEI